MTLKSIIALKNETPASTTISVANQEIVSIRLQESQKNAVQFTVDWKIVPNLKDKNISSLLIATHHDSEGSWAETLAVPQALEMENVDSLLQLIESAAFDSDIRIRVSLAAIKAIIHHFPQLKINRE